MNKRITAVCTAHRRCLARILFACIASFSVLAVCSKSSFLYPMNALVADYRGGFIRLVDGQNEDEKSQMLKEAVA